ncbi:MAG: ATP-binding protein [Candidatus Nanopelagicales bacterium]|nr:ATP-binding protein [Candidatus Nanopelagicales bacterium]MDZ4249893.1 ATP-binding protein [Candidatus Nanopelagicales bacterium]
MASWKPSPHEVARILVEQSPWHATGAVPTALAQEVERPLARMLWRPVLDPGNPRRAHVILGPRRVGKTTVMYQTVRRLLAEGILPGRLWWLRMDHPFLMREPLGDLVRRVIEETQANASSEVYLFLDELVYAADWDLWLKTFHDERWPVRIVGTSSATAALRDRHRESGVGRWDEHHLGPYQFSEYLDLVSFDAAVDVGPNLAETLTQMPRSSGPRRDLAELRRTFALVGGFPELLMADQSGADMETRLLRSQQRLRDEAIERAVYKDIPQSFGIDNPMLLERLLYVLAGQVAGILSPSNLTKELDGLSQPTLDRYISYLEQTFLVFRTLNYSGTEASVQRRGRKLYFLDGAVRNAALQRGLAPLTDPAEMGLVLEGLVASALHSLALQSGHRLYHWRHAKTEVDFVLDHPSGPVAFEVASSPSHHLGGLRKLVELHPKLADRAYLVSPDSPTRAPKHGEPGSLPLDSLLVAVGRQADAAAAHRLRAGHR